MLYFREIFLKTQKVTKKQWDLGVEHRSERDVFFSLCVFCAWKKLSQKNNLFLK